MTEVAVSSSLTSVFLAQLFPFPMWELPAPTIELVIRILISLFSVEVLFYYEIRLSHLGTMVPLFSIELMPGFNFQGNFLEQTSCETRGLFRYQQCKENGAYNFVLSLWSIICANDCGKTYS